MYVAAAVCDLAHGCDDFLVVLAIEQQFDAGANDSMVVDDDGSNHLSGTSATSVVPVSGDDSTVSFPSSSATRSRMPSRPRPSSRTVAGSKPRPSSSITAVAAPPRRMSRMLTFRAPPGLTVFVSASCPIL